MDRTLERCRDLDSRLVQAAKDIKILSRLSWPESTERAFLEAWAAGRPALPEAPALRLDHGEKLAALRALRRECDRSHPVGRYLDDTAASYLTVFPTGSARPLKFSSHNSPGAKRGFGNRSWTIGGRS